MIGVREGHGVREVYHGVRKVYHGVNHQLLVSIFKGKSNIRTVLSVTNKRERNQAIIVPSRFLV